MQIKCCPAHILQGHSNKSKVLSAGLHVQVAAAENTPDWRLIKHLPSLGGSRAKYTDDESVSKFMSQVPGLVGWLAALRAAVSETTAKWRKRLLDVIPEFSEWSADTERDQY